MSNAHAALVVAVTALVTIALRFLPFAIFRGSKPVPPFVAYLGRVLPYAIMGMLVVYCLRNTNFTGHSHGLPEIIACAAVALLHLWKRNTLISIVGGTAVYMLLVQLVFL